MISKTELKRQLTQLGLKVVGNYVKKEDILKTIEKNKKTKRTKSNTWADEFRKKSKTDEAELGNSTKSLTFKHDAEIEVVDSYDEKNDVVESHNEKFKAGQKIDVDIINENSTYYVEIQFGDGSAAYDIPKKLFQ